MASCIKEIKAIANENIQRNSNFGNEDFPTSDDHRHFEHSDEEREGGDKNEETREKERKKEGKKKEEAREKEGKQQLIKIKINDEIEGEFKKINIFFGVFVFFVILQSTK